ncbi:MAG: serine/threonine-protein kinase [Mycobacterium sp.]
MPLANGAVFAGYTIVRSLGSGAMGEVYLAEHPRLPRADALKVLPESMTADSQYRERFNREADLAAGLFHPHIVSVHDRGEFNGRLWISMDYVEGTDVAQLMRDRYPAGMPTDEALTIVTAVAGALDYAHHRGLVHRDVKPSNILLTRPDDEGERRILLADFGIARPLADVSGLTATNVTLGTVAYAAPEQLLGKDIDGRADQYALAATAFHLLTGAPPYRGTNAVLVISQHLTAIPPKLSDRRPDLARLDDAMSTALAKDPSDRFARCREFARALSGQQAIGTSIGDRETEVGITASTVTLPPEPPPASMGGTRRWWQHPATVIAASMSLLLVGALIFVGIQASRNRQSPPTGTASASPTLTPTFTPQPTPLSPTAATPAPSPPLTSSSSTVAVPSTSSPPAGGAEGFLCNASNAARLGYDPNTGKEKVCVNQALTPSMPPTWEWAEPPPMTTGVHATGTSCDMRLDSMSRSTDGYLISCQPIHRGDPYGGYWQHYMGPIE